MHPILGKLFARGSVKKQFYRDRFAGEFLGRVDPCRVFTIIAVAIAYVFDTTSPIAISLMLAVYLFYRNYRKYSVLLLAAMGGDALIVSIIKTLIQSPRPLNGLVYDTGFLFPADTSRQA